jgi:hypothetical protein
MIIGFQIPKTEHVPPLGGLRLCQGNYYLISNEGISLDKALAPCISTDDGQLIAN